MERLRDHLDSPDPDRALAARLLASGEPDELTDERAARIERRLWHASRVPARPGWLRPAVLAVVVFGVASMALAHSATVRDLVESWFATPAPSAAEGVSGTSTAREPTPPSVPSSVPQLVDAGSPPPITAPASPPTVDVSELRPPSTEAGARVARPAPPRSPDPVAFVFRQQLSPELIALRNAGVSLRRDQDPERAAMFLTFYMDRYRDGRFIEEAFALAIEAAQARHATDAPLLARRYLQRFPQGRYRVLAERVARRESRRP